MNAVVKYLVTDLVVRTVAKGVHRAAEASLATIDPKKHEAYVDFVTETADARIEAFVARNANLAQKVLAKTEEVKVNSEEAFKQAQEVIAPLLDFIKQGGTNENK